MEPRKPLITVDDSSLVEEGLAGTNPHFLPAKNSPINAAETRRTDKNDFAMIADNWPTKPEELGRESFFDLLCNLAGCVLILTPTLFIGTKTILS
jgi:hypothetical protein